jgi:hypothetical protein
MFENQCWLIALGENNFAKDYQKVSNNKKMIKKRLKWLKNY